MPPVYLVHRLERGLTALDEALAREPRTVCVRLVPALADDQTVLATLKSLKPILEPRDIALVVEDRVGLVKSAGIDGVHLLDAEAVGAARKALGEGYIVGAGAGASRHAAMVAAEAGADYVSLAPDPDLIGWWAEIMEIPCVADLPDPAARAEMAQAGADFVALPTEP